MAKVNWQKAKQDYISNPTLSYLDVAKKYRVSPRMVAKVGSSENWPRLRDEFAKKVQQKFIEKAPDAATEARLRHLKYSKLLQAKSLGVVKNTKPKSFESAQSTLISATKLENESLGIEPPKKIDLTLQQMREKEKQIIARYLVPVEE
jgi:hypothetical protein